jgi:thymidylate kinase
MTRGRDDKVKTISRREPILVSFSGIDGAGKSTQIDNLCRYLRAVGVRFQLLTFWDDAAALKPLRESAGHKIFKGDKGVGSPDAPIERRDKNIRSPFMSFVRVGLYFLDAISLRRVARRALRSGTDVVIFDRYIYDEFANLNLKNAVVRLYVRFLMKIVPKPMFGFVLDADPLQARARKPEYPLEFLISNRNLYLQLSEFLDDVIVIPSRSIQEAKAEVIRYFSPHFFASTIWNHDAKQPSANQRSSEKAPLDGLECQSNGALSCSVLPRPQSTSM